MPSKVQFDHLATSWVTAEQDVEEVVNDRIINQTYRLTFEHCLANTCKRNCIGNPRCLSALGGNLSAGDQAQKKLTEITNLKNSDYRELSEPAGLRNLGATCYLNSLLQVWFHNATFRDVILRWSKELDTGEQSSLNKELPETILGHVQLIFARLLRSIRRFVDPTALVEMLGIDAEYQQDASECCSLLLNVILDQLRTYCDGTLANELAEAYRGKQATVIKCENCGAVKKCLQDFYNMILNVQGHRDVRQCIKSLGQSRKIEGDFTCGICASKKGAMTFEEFIEMPPVLNLQLMRYRYDAKSGSKKKVQTILRFPNVLDLGPYVQGFEGKLLYELRAVLVHVGNSANSGHYIANVKTSDNVWFRLNDENVSAMKGRLELHSETEVLDGKESVPSENGDKEEKNGSNGHRVQAKEDNGKPPVMQRDFINPGKPTTNALDDAKVPHDGTNTIPTVKSQESKNSTNKQNRKLTSKGESDEHLFSSTGAYMLVYEKVKADTTDQSRSSSSCSQPLHSYLENIIQREHAENVKTVEQIDSIRTSSASKAQELLTDFEAIYNALPLRTNDKYRFVTTTKLSRTLKKAERLFKSLCASIERPLAPAASESTLESQIDSSDNFSCAHGKLTPEGSSLSKLRVISSEAGFMLDNFCEKYEFSESWCQRPPIPQDLCRECVVRLGQRVAQLSQLAVDAKLFTASLKNKACEKAYWVDNKSFQVWYKLAENQILSRMNPSLAAKSEEFNGKLKCVHGYLAINNKKCIPQEAWLILQKYFPNSVAYQTDTEECDICRNECLAEEAIASQRADAITVLRQNLKGMLKFRRTFLESETSAFAIHFDQASVIRKYLRTPAKLNKVPKDFTTSLFCVHGNSLVAEKDGTFSEAVVLVTPEEWDVLQQKFAFENFVKITKNDNCYEISPPPCEVCLRQMKLEDEQAQSEFHNVEIKVVKLTFEELIQKYSVETNPEPMVPQVDDCDLAVEEPALKKARVCRSSRKPNTRTINLSSNETFVHLKVKIMARHHITPILQIILSGDKLLKDIDGEQRISEMGIKPGSILYVAEDLYPVGENDMDKKKNAKEEMGFGGTKLMG